MEARIQAATALLEAVDVLLSPSRDLADAVAGLGARAPEVFALPLLRPMPAAPPPGEGPLRILFAGALIPTKGPDRLLEAFSALPPGCATLGIAGHEVPFDGAPRFAEELRFRVEATPGARWLGHVSPDRVGALLGAHDLLVLPSIWRENSPIIVREAAAAGLRQIVPELGGAAEIVPEARTVPNRRHDHGALLHALRAEVALGRGRVAPRRWPTPEEHATWLIERVYLRGAGRTGSLG